MTRQALGLNSGGEAKRSGPTVGESEHEIMPAAATITTAYLRRVRRRSDIPIPVTRAHVSQGHSLDPIAGWLPIDDSLDSPFPT